MCIYNKPKKLRNVKLYNFDADHLKTLFNLSTKRKKIKTFIHYYWPDKNNSFHSVRKGKHKIGGFGKSFLGQILNQLLVLLLSVKDQVFWRSLRNSSILLSVGNSPPIKQGCFKEYVKRPLGTPKSLEKRVSIMKKYSRCDKKRARKQESFSRFLGKFFKFTGKYTSLKGW